MTKVTQIVVYLQEHTWKEEQAIYTDMIVLTGIVCMWLIVVELSQLFDLHEHTPLEVRQRCLY